MNFDEMIDKLYKIESRHAQQLLRWKSDWNERTLAFADLRKELTSFRATLGSLNSVDKFLVKDGVKFNMFHFVSDKIRFSFNLMQNHYK